MQITLVRVANKAKVKEPLLKAVAKELGKNDFVVKISKKDAKIPKSAYNSAREQYDASDILPSVKPVGGIGITAEDIYEGGLNFVFGLAETEGSGIVSLSRLDPARYGEPGGKRRLVERAAKEVMHEVGHTMGMKHCQNKVNGKPCVMTFSTSIHEVDEKAAKFCKEHTEMADLK